MSLMSSLLPLLSSIGADIRGLSDKSAILSVTGATSLIQTQKIIADQVLRSVSK